MVQFPEQVIRQRVSLQGLGEVLLVEAAYGACSDSSRNIFLVDQGGRVLWQVQSAVRSHDVAGYSNLHLNEQGELLAYSANGIEYLIDQASGNILRKELIR